MVSIWKDTFTDNFDPYTPTSPALLIANHVLLGFEANAECLFETLDLVFRIFAVRRDRLFGLLSSLGLIRPRLALASHDAQSGTISGAFAGIVIRNLPDQRPGRRTANSASSTCALGRLLGCLCLLGRLLLLLLGVFVDLKRIYTRIVRSPAITLGLILGLLRRHLSGARKYVNFEGCGQRLAR